jgi:hypothetical protein
MGDYGCGGDLHIGGKSLGGNGARIIMRLPHEEKNPIFGGGYRWD